MSDSMAGGRISFLEAAELVRNDFVFFQCHSPWLRSLGVLRSPISGDDGPASQPADQPDSPSGQTKKDDDDERTLTRCLQLGLSLDGWFVRWGFGDWLGSVETPSLKREGRLGKKRERANGPVVGCRKRTARDACLCIMSNRLYESVPKTTTTITTLSHCALRPRASD